ncbi:MULTISPECIES: isochorismatase family protein [Haloferax]|nr:MULTISPECIES: isochorismatase family protein [Haloferax]
MSDDSDLYIPDIVPASDVAYLESQSRYGNRVGWGERPALLVVDATEAFLDGRRTTPDCVADTARLLDAARSVDVPVFYAVPSGRSLPEGYPVPIKGSASSDRTPDDATTDRDREDWVAKLDRLPPAIEPRESEHVVEKPRASAFFDTHLANLLHYYGVDTLVVCGTNTGGCLRATVVDSHSSGFRTIVPPECVADAVTLTHEVALFDMDLRYADVTPLEDVLSKLETVASADST